MKKKFPQIKKNIKGFLSSEEGKIDKKSLLKMGIGLGMISLFLTADETGAAVDHSSHGSNHTNVPEHTSSYLDNPSKVGRHFSSFTPHSSSHGSHSEGGWMC